MGKCLWCGGNYFPPVRWSNLLDVENNRGFCGQCRSKLEPLTGESLCLKCGRDLKMVPSAYVHAGLCSDCVKWGPSDILTMNRSLFTYNLFLQEVVTRFKFRGDALLVAGFQDDWRKLYRQYFKNCLPVPIPLSVERLAERHFNQARILAALLSVPPADLLIRVQHNTKQSKKSRHERLESGDNPFVLNQNVGDFRGKSFVIIDDIYTTGTTVRHAARTLNALQPTAIYSMTLAR
jgi:competence protein ComFC